MKIMKVWASIPEAKYQFIQDVIGFVNFDEWLEDKIKGDKRYEQYRNRKQY